MVIIIVNVVVYPCRHPQLYEYLHLLERSRAGQRSQHCGFGYQFRRREEIDESVAASLPPPSFVAGHLDVRPMVIFGNWSDAPDGWLFAKLQLLARRSGCLTSLQDTFGVG